MSKKRTFLTDKPLLTAMVQADTPERVKELTVSSIAAGAEAIGMQFCRMMEAYKNEQTFQELFSLTGDLPIYATNYRFDRNEKKSDDTLAAELLKIAECGATLCDVMGDYFDRCQGELTEDTAAVKRQMALIDALHERGAEVLMSSHISKFTPAERILEVALAHKARGADIAKIVTGADSPADEIENLRITHLLREHLGIPFLFLSVGKCRIHRRLGGLLGNCMTLCVYEYDRFSTPTQPLLRDIKLLRDELGL